ncbi:MAG: hypothetical protein HRU32_08015 [Rhodobacteraceae bacterium]|nr:hypothetical protein [Paracoccaceae bacterium]
MQGAIEDCEALRQSFAETFQHQYLLSQTQPETPEGWTPAEALNGWFLTHCPKLPCQPILSAEGEQVGWLFGVAVDQSGTLKSQTPIELGLNPGAKGFWTHVEDHLTSLAGKYIVILPVSEGGRIYADPVCDLPLVFNRDARLIAASPLLALPRARRTNPDFDAREILANGGNYGLQQTCDPDVLRMLSNHYLDLATFDLHRHWPRAETDLGAFEGNIDALADQLTNRLGQITTVLLSSYRCAFPISGGGDSRIMAYSARGAMGKAAYHYAHADNWISQIDCYVGLQVARDLGQAFTIYDSRAAIDAGDVSRFERRQLKRRFMLRTGYQAPPSPAALVSADRIPPADLLLRGNILDMTRANQWRAGQKGFDPDHGLTRLAMAADADGSRQAGRREAYLAWYETLPDAARDRAPDFAFVEQLLPNTLGARLMGFGGPFYVNPFNDRALIAATMRVSPRDRRLGNLNSALQRAVSTPNIPLTGVAKNDPDTKSAMRALFEDKAPVKTFARDAGA